MPEEPFGHLNTDEVKADSPYPRQAMPPTDAQQIGGCLVFTIASLLQVGIGLAVFILLPPITQSALVTTGLVFCGGGLIAGIILTLIGREAGAFGSIAGTAPAGIFAWLRLRELALGYEGVKGMEPAGYPEAVSWAFPTIYFLLGSAVWLFVLAIRNKVSKR